MGKNPKEYVLTVGSVTVIFEGVGAVVTFGVILAVPLLFLLAVIF